MAAEWSSGAGAGGGIPLPREVRKIECSYFSGGHRKQSVRARLGARLSRAGRESARESLALRDLVGPNIGRVMTRPT